MAGESENIIDVESRGLRSSVSEFASLKSDTEKSTLGDVHDAGPANQEESEDGLSPSSTTPDLNDIDSGKCSAFPDSAAITRSLVPVGTDFKDEEKSEVNQVVQEVAKEKVREEAEEEPKGKAKEAEEYEMEDKDKGGGQS
jgi:hypothetical protein